MNAHVRRGGVLAAAVLLAVSGVSGCAAPPTPELSAPAHAGHTASPAQPQAPLREGERFVDLGMASAYTPVPPHGGTDDYRCFLIDPGLTAPTFVTGSQFLPQNTDVLHHAIFFRVDPEDVAQARVVDERDAGDGWTCFSGTGIGGRSSISAGAGWIGAWAPGGQENLAPEGTGYSLAPGSQIVMQIHYNLLATGGKAAGADRSGFRLRVMDGAANLRPLRTTLLAAPVELPCPADESGPLCERSASIEDIGARFGNNAQVLANGLNLLCNRGVPVPGTTQQCDQSVRAEGEVFAVAGHMHLLGRSITVELNPGTPGARTLLDVPAYDFDNQNARPLAEPVPVSPGDVLRVTCTHDATLRRQLPELKPLPPRYVVWGDGTSDEMCLGIVIWARP
jgi:hypothetical protein